MACGGCRRNKKSSGSRVKPDKSLKTTKAVATKIVINSVLLADRKKKCSRCPFNTLSGLTGRCKKVNRIISKAINDPSFKCPIKRF